MKSINNFLNDDGKIFVWPKKPADKELILKHISRDFKEGVIYTEKEVNTIIAEAHSFEDNELLRRMMIGYKLLNRTQDCRQYWKVAEA